MVLDQDFYQRPDVVSIARELLGKVLVSQIDGELTSGIIVETEAYAGTSDKASHAFGNRRTNRTEIMYRPGGVAYVYLCYGIHHLFNIVTNVADEPHAVLIRAIEPLDGIDHMIRRRKASELTPSLTAGPGSMSASMGITRQFSGVDLDKLPLFVEDRGIDIDPINIIAGTRVGVAYAQEDALLPYRFSIAGNKYVSRGKGLPIMGR
jgi:DNA-3-methyladenine glycosylase